MRRAFGIAEMGYTMSEASMSAREVRVRFERSSSGLIFATSPDLSGLVVARTSVEELAVAVPEAIRAMYNACGVHVFVTPLETTDQEEGEESWVALPTSIAREALQKV